VSISNDQPARWPESTASKTLLGTRVSIKTDAKQKGPENTDVLVRCERIGKVTKIEQDKIHVLTDTGEVAVCQAGDVEAA
jgi:hypothetical protein